MNLKIGLHYNICQKSKLNEKKSGTKEKGKRLFNKFLIRIQLTSLLQRKPFPNNTALRARKGSKIPLLFSIRESKYDKTLLKL